MTDTQLHHPCAVLKIGLWNGGQTGYRGGLLYRTLMSSALAHGLCGATAQGAVEGSRAARSVRTIESEVISNELPMLIDFADRLERITAWIPVCTQHVRNHGVVVVESGNWEKGGLVVANHGDRVTTGPMQDRNQHPRQGLQSTDGLELQLFTLERNQIDGRPVYQAVAEFLRSRGVLWISISRGTAGYGERREVHQAKWFRRTDVPIVMTILDTQAKLQPHLADLVRIVGGEGLVVSKPVAWHHP